MKTCLTLLGLALLVAIATWAYDINYDTRDAARRVDDLRQDIAAERATLAVLRAEWAYLNRPDRLRALAERHFPDLMLMSLDADHFADPDRLPWPPDEDLPIFDVDGMIEVRQ